MARKISQAVALESWWQAGHRSETVMVQRVMLALVGDQEYSTGRKVGQDANGQEANTDMQIPPCTRARTVNLQPTGAKSAEGAAGASRRPRRSQRSQRSCSNQVNDNVSRLYITFIAGRRLRPMA